MIDTAIILAAGLGKRMRDFDPIIPKPLIKINNKPFIQYAIDLLNEIRTKEIIINVHYKSDEILKFIQSLRQKNIIVSDESELLLNTGGGILNMINNSSDNDYLIFNPDTLWSENYTNEIKNMCNFYFSNKLSNILLTVDKELSFDKSFKGDFRLRNNLLEKANKNNFIYIGCQILNRNLFKNLKVENFSIFEIWNELLKKNELNGFESFNKFFHLTNLETFKKLRDL